MYDPLFQTIFLFCKLISKHRKVVFVSIYVFLYRYDFLWKNVKFPTWLYKFMGHISPIKDFSVQRQHNNLNFLFLKIWWPEKFNRSYKIIQYWKYMTALFVAYTQNSKYTGANRKYITVRETMINKLFHIIA